MFPDARLPRMYAAVAPADATTLPPNIGVVVGGAGTLIVKMRGPTNATATAVTLTVVAGQIVWGDIQTVMTASTATGLVAMVV